MAAPNGQRRGPPRQERRTVAESIDFGPLATWIGFNLRMAQEAAFQAFSRRSQEIGESPGRFATLTLIERNPGHQPDRAQPGRSAATSRA